MATDFWASSHYKRWIVDRATLRHARSEDLEYVDDPEHLAFLAIFFANVITKLGKKLQLRQRVIATATVFFRRFYLKNAYCETDPFVVISACVYVAAKAEESSIHIKNVISESRSLFSQAYGIKTFPSDNSKLAEMEFYLVDDLECDMVVFHPYRTLLALCRKEAAKKGDDAGSSPFFGEEGEEGEEEEEVGEVVGVGVGLEDGPRYWGSGMGKLVLSEAALQTAWSIINDTYRSELCLLHPPHLIAIAALYLTFILHPPEKKTNTVSETQQPRRSSRQAATVGPSLSKFKPPPSLPAKPVTSFPPVATSSNSSTTSTAPNTNPDPITFLAQLNVSLPLVATIAQEIISLYTLWDRYKEDGTPDATSGGISITALSSMSRSSSLGDGATGKKGGISVAADSTADGANAATSALVTPSFLLQILLSMREARLLDLALGGEGELLGLPQSAASAAAIAGHGYHAPVNKVLERAMNAGYG